MKSNTDKYIARNREYVRDLKSKPCTDCGNCYHFAAMQYDHIGSDKTENIARLVTDAVSIARLQEEIDKCELVCSNCHAVRTWNRSNGN